MRVTKMKAYVMVSNLNKYNREQKCKLYRDIQVCYQFRIRCSDLCPKIAHSHYQSHPIMLLLFVWSMQVCVWFLCLFQSLFKEAEEISRRKVQLAEKQYDMIDDRVKMMDTEMTNFYDEQRRNFLEESQRVKNRAFHYRFFAPYVSEGLFRCQRSLPESCS